jgi:hypothetical protein
MAKKSSASTMYYSPDGWFLNFLFLAILIAGIVSATVLAQRRAMQLKAAAPPAPQVMNNQY